MASIPQGAFAVRKVRGAKEEHAVSMMEKKEKNEEKKENIFNPRPFLEGNISLFGFTVFTNQIFTLDGNALFIWFNLFDYLILLNVQDGSWRRSSTTANWWTASGACTIATRCITLRRTLMPRRGPAAGWLRRSGALFWRISPRPPMSLPPPPRKPPRS